MSYENLQSATQPANSIGNRLGSTAAKNAGNQTFSPTSTQIRSRLSAPPTASGRAVERPGLVEFLRELAFESGLTVGDRALRVGLASTAWQLQEGIKLLERQGMPNPLTQTQISSNPERVVALAMTTAINPRDTGVLGTIWLRRDTAEGLALDRHHPAALASMREHGAKIVAVESLAFDPTVPLTQILSPMLRALRRIVLDMWGATDIVTECPTRNAAYYCNKLGFSQVADAVSGGPNYRDTVLLHMSTGRMADLPAEDASETMIA